MTIAKIISLARLFCEGGSSGGGGGSGGGDGWIGDGNTHIWISLADGRTSPMLGCCPNGTVTVDWGDGTAPDLLTGISTTTVKWTPTHNYARAGDYVITLTVDGEMGFYGSDFHNQYSGILRYTSGSDARNKAYQSAAKKVEIGNGVTTIGNCAFELCKSLSSVLIPGSVTSIGKQAFGYCNLYSIVIPDGVTYIESYLFYDCYSLSSVTIPDGVTSISGSSFYHCEALSSVTIPGSVTSIENSAFDGCVGVRYYDFTANTSVPTLKSSGAFSGIAEDCQMLIPAALYDEWSTATNWAQFASYMVAV